jgi:hypothetical protein
MLISGTSSRAWGTRALATLLVLGLSFWARAQGGSEAVRVEYRAPTACPNQAAFEAELAQHLGATTLAKLGELARTLTIVIDENAGAYRARVELMDRDGNSTSREDTAPTCEQAMGAIALVAALAARSQAERSATASRTAEPDGGSSTEPGVPDGGPIEDQQTEPERAPDEATSTATSAKPRTADRESKGESQTELELEREVSGGLTLATGVGPGAAFGIALGGRLGLAGTVSRSIALSARANDTFRRELAAADVRMRVIKGRLELCPFEPLLGASLRLSPCPGFEAGSQSGEAYEDAERVVQSSREARLWLAATLAARLRLRAGSVGIAFGPELVVPLTKNSFRLSQPDRLVYEVPDIAVGAEATIGFVW